MYTAIAHGRSARRWPRRFGATMLGATLALAPATALPAFAADPPPDSAAWRASVTGLGPGDRGEPVRALQEALLAAGLSLPGGADGVFGAATARALTTFQAANGLPPTGIVDLASALALELIQSPFEGLVPGSSGDAVRELQWRLVDLGASLPGGADGVFGDATTAAVAALQTAAGLASTGTVDAATAALLEQPADAPRIPSGEQPAVDPADGDGSAGASDAAGEVAGVDAMTLSPDLSALIGLRVGRRGDAVVRLQQLLLDAGYTVVGGADGIFGALTADALARFRADRGLPAGTTVDEATLAALAAAGSSDTPPPSARPQRTGGFREVGSDGDQVFSADTSPATVADASTELVGLRHGSLGGAVKELQRALLDAGITLRGGADGIFGSATRAALQEYQRSQGLTVTGEVDEATLAALSAGAGPSVVTPSALLGLRHGALGAAVRELQQALIDAGVTVRGGADGIFGPATKAALEEFQRRRGLTVTGVVDQATVDALADPAGADGGGDGGGDVAAGAGYAEYGERGDRVVALQQALVDAGIALRGGIDGLFGSGTSAAVMEIQRRNGLRVTGVVDQATAGVLGLDPMAAPKPPDASGVELSVFPVEPVCFFADTWHAPRGGGRVHLGTDIIADAGNEIYAVDDGRITKLYDDYPGSLAGNGVRLTADDGTYFFYAHMTERAPGIGVGSEVRAGDVIGFIGSTGNSSTPHLHFEVHPGGGAAVNPYPLLLPVDACG